MKESTKTAFISLAIFPLLFLVTSCLPPPKYKGDFNKDKIDDNPTVDTGDGTGDPSGEDEPIKGSPVEVKDTYSPLTCNQKSPLGFRAWRRLSNLEVRNTIQDTFGVTNVAIDSLPDDITRLGVYDTMMISSNFMDSQRFRAYREIVKTIVPKIDLGKYLPCLKDGPACISSQLPKLLAVAWRRPASTDEVSKLSTLFNSTAADLGNEEAARTVIKAILQAESFLYRSELGTKSDGNTYTLDSWELASAISYGILRRPPDAELRKAAEEKKLANESELKKQVNRLLSDPVAKVSIKDFASMWMDSRVARSLNRPKLPALTNEVKEKIALEAGDLFSDTIFRSSGSTFESLLNADSIPASTSIIYDAMPANGRIQFKEPERRGLLGQASFLMGTSGIDETNPIKRGAFVVERMLCTSFAPAPVVTLPPRKEGESNIQRFKNLEKISGCKNCHTTMNQFGFVFENFDANGKFRTMADGETVMVNSEVNIDGKMVPIKSAAELSLAIAKSDQGKECYSRHLLRYALGRYEYTPMPMIGAKPGAEFIVTAQGEADACHIKAMSDAMTESDGDLKAPLVTLLTSEGFRKRINRKAEKTGH